MSRLLLIRNAFQVTRRCVGRRLPRKPALPHVLQCWGSPASNRSAVKIGVLDFDPQANGLRGQFPNVACSLPGHRAFDFVADDLVAVLRRESRQGMALGILNFDVQAAGCRGRDVQQKSVARKSQRVCEEFSSGESCGSKRGRPSASSIGANGPSAGHSSDSRTETFPPVPSARCSGPDNSFAIPSFPVRCPDAKTPQETCGHSGSRRGMSAAPHLMCRQNTWGGRGAASPRRLTRLCGPA